MSGKTKIMVFKMKELIYTAVFVVLGILLILLLVWMFLGKNKKEETPAEQASTYIAGVYTSTIQLGNQTLDVQVSVDSDKINSIEFVNLDEAVSAMYPLMPTALSSLSTQILQNQSLEGVTYSEEMKYTAQILLNAIHDALEKAKAQENTTEEQG